MEGGVLILKEVGRQDSGQYICNATNIHGYSEAYTDMEVESKCTSDRHKQTFAKAAQTIRVFNNNVRITIFSL